MRTIDPITWHLIVEAARVHQIEIMQPGQRASLTIRSPQGAGPMLLFIQQVQPWLFVNRVTVPDYNHVPRETWEYGAELLPR